MLTVKQLAAISENPDPVYYDLAGDLEALVPEMRKAGITTKRRVAAFLGNVSVETDRLKTLEEYGGYSYWLYLDRMSGRAGEWRYHGRGYLMNTWRSAYALLSRALGVDLVANPDLLSTDKALAAKAAVWFWQKNDLNSYADLGTTAGYKDVCDIINTGNEWGSTNHWSERSHHYELATRILPAGFDLGVAPPPKPEEEEEDVTTTRRVIFPEVFKAPEVARRVQEEIRSRVQLPPDKTVVVRDAGAGERVVIPQVFTSVPTAERVRSQIRARVDLPEGKTVVLHTPRSRQRKPGDVTESKPPSRPKPETDKLKEDVEQAIAFGLKMLEAPYGDGWEEGTWPALSSLYSRITRHDPATYYDDLECICAGLINVLRFEVAGLPSCGRDQGDGWPGGTAAIWRHFAFAPGSRPYPPVENTPRGWLVVAPYAGAALRFQGHVGVALGNGKVLEARVPILSANRTEDEGARAIRAGGARGYERIVPPEVWLRK